MTTFSDLEISPVFVTALGVDKITEPTPIQAKAIPALLAGKNAYLSSETGTGKTLAYLLPLFAHIDPVQRALQAIVVVPSHELAVQICDLGRALAQNANAEIRLLALIGGTSLKRQVEKLKNKPHMVVGTPGRIKELIDLRKVRPHTVETVVIDEADRLLMRENLAAIDRIIKSTLPQRQLVFVSATKQAESSQQAEVLAPDLVQIDAGPNRINPAIEHAYIECQKRDKPVVLRKLLHALRPERAIVFLHKNDNTEELTAKLLHHKISAVDLHGSQDNSRRRTAISDFRRAAANVLVASDIAARGLDIRGVSHVVNYDIPTRSKDYLHRVGRTSRAGSQGYAVSLMAPPELRLVARYEKELGIAVRAASLQRGVFTVD